MTFRQFLANEMHDVVYSYSSTQIYLPDDLSDQIIEWGHQRITHGVVYTDPDDPSFGRENEIHTTVLYGIHTDDPKPVQELLRSQKPFTCKLGRVTLFKTNPKFDVVKIDVRSSELHRLHQRLNDHLEVTNSYPVYKPHVTIAYVKRGKADDLAGNRDFEGKKFEVAGIVFSSRSGKKTTLPLEA